MGALYTLREIARAVGGMLSHADAQAEVTEISIDSRDIAPGALFVAIAGDRFDGHDFVAQALANGAVGAMISSLERPRLPVDVPLICVSSALDGLGALGRHARNRSAARVAAVTGSAGKTSTKEALAAILAAEAPTHASVKSFNNHWGVPLTLARLPRDAAYGVFEIGMNHAGEITPLVAMVRPQVALVTSIGEAHLEHLGSLAAIADAKAEIFSGLEPDGTAVINADHDYLDRLVGAARDVGAKVVTYGLSDAADYRVIPEAASDTSRAAGRIAGPDLDIALTLSTSGTHTLVNAAGAMLAARALGVAPARAAATLVEHRAGAGRGELLELGPAENPLVLLDESYNANPASMRAALAVLAGLPVRGGAGRKVLVLGDMRELGAAAAGHHGDLAGPVLASGAEAVYLVGTQMAHLVDALPQGLVRMRCRTVQELIDPLLAGLAYGDVVMIKGSNGERLGVVVEAIKSHFGQSRGV